MYEISESGLNICVNMRLCWAGLWPKQNTVCDCLKPRPLLRSAWLRSWGCILGSKDISSEFNTVQLQRNLVTIQDLNTLSYSLSFLFILQSHLSVAVNVSIMPIMQKRFTKTHIQTIYLELVNINLMNKSLTFKTSLAGNLIYVDGNII